MDGRKKRRFWNVVTVLCAVVAVVCVGILLYIAAQRHLSESALRAAALDPLLTTAAPATPAPTAIPETEEETAQPTPECSPTPGPVEVPIDFPYLQGINGDIRAWLVMPFTQQEYPVLMRMNEDDYYIDHGVRGEYSAAGSLFIQSLFNSADFNDPCTVIYGHNMAAGTMFGSLRRSVPSLDLGDAEDANNYLTVYTPHGIRTYRIRCAGRYSDENILFSRDFSRPGQVTEFFRSFPDYAGDYYWHDESFVPAEDGKYLVLSTCFQRNSEYRFLLVAELTEQQGY